jgi:hypothetical protein
VLPWALLASDESSLTRRSGDTLVEDRRRWWNPVTTGEAECSLLFGGSSVLSFSRRAILCIFIPVFFVSYSSPMRQGGGLFDGRSTETGFE